MYVVGHVFMVCVRGKPDTASTLIISIIVTMVVHPPPINNPKQVVFLRSFSDQQKSLLLSACTAVLYTPQHEHFGIVPLEAMAWGKAVVACDSGGPKESVVQGRTGFLCEPNAESFADAMVKLMVCRWLGCVKVACCASFHHHRSIIITSHTGCRGGCQDGKGGTGACGVEL